MSGKIELLVLDVDGTLIGQTGEITDVVRDSVADALDRGLRIALCSGRPLASCWPLVKTLGLKGPQIVFNGALVKDPVSPTAVLSRPVPIEPARELVQYCRANDLCCELYTAETHYVERDWRESRLHAISIRVTYEIGSLDDVLDRGEIVKIQIITADDRARGLVASIAKSMDGVLGFSTAIPMPPAIDMECINVVDPRVSKGEAVRALIGHLGLSRSNVAAAGDAPNDIPVFEEVGFRIAMGNADPTLKSMADYVAPDVNEDGLATAIRDILERE